MREKTPRPTDGTLKLFIGNIAYEATDSDVRKLFEPVAPIRVRVWVSSERDSLRVTPRASRFLGGWGATVKQHPGGPVANPCSSPR